LTRYYEIIAIERIAFALVYDYQEYSLNKGQGIRKENIMTVIENIVEAKMDGVVIRHTGKTSYENKNAPENTLYKPCFWSARSFGKEYDGTPKKGETVEDYQKYITDTLARCTEVGFLVKYNLDNNGVAYPLMEKRKEVSAVNPKDKKINKDFGLKVGIVREIDTTQAEKWFNTVKSKGGKTWVKILIDAFWSGSPEGMGKVTSFLNYILAKESTADIKKKESVQTANITMLTGAMEIEGVEAETIAQNLLDKIAKGEITMKQAFAEALNH